MAVQTVFKRYELKYMISQEQKTRIQKELQPYMKLDKYGRTTIRNIYYDTNNYRLIRHSIEKPAYKEKLRIRSYGQPAPDETCFVELKKKYNSVVYKRRVFLPETEAIEWLSGKNHCHSSSQISKEIDYFLDYYESLHPTLFISYQREAFYAKDDSDFRITFDDNILCRQDDFSLSSHIYGLPILDKDKVLMEIKCSGGIPLWMTSILSKEHIYKTPFSKYGTAYKKYILPKLKEDSINV